MFLKRNFWSAVLISLIIQFNVSGQSEGSIIYMDYTGGVTIGEISGFTYGASGNFRFQNNILTGRALYTLGENEDTGTKKPSIFPVFNGEDTVNEVAFLYGRALTTKPANMTVSVGISSNIYKFKTVESGLVIKNRKTYIGFPFEVNINTLKMEKKGTQFIFGAKLYGNISEASYVGIGFNIGLGWSKNE